MKFNGERACECGGVYPFSTYGEAPWPVVSCSACGKAAGQINLLSVSVTAERLLYRSKAEFESGDYSLAIVIGTMAIESYLTRLFFKVKGMDYYSQSFAWPTEAQEKHGKLNIPRKVASAVRPAILCLTLQLGANFSNTFATTNVVAIGTWRFPDAAGKFCKAVFPNRTVSSAQPHCPLGIREHHQRRR